MLIKYLNYKTYKMFLIYSIEDKLLLKPDDLNSKSADNTLKLYQEIILEKIEEKYIGKVISKS